MSKINFSPEGASPLTSFRCFNLDLETTMSGRQRLRRRIGYMENFRNSGEPCLFIHGSSNGTVTGFKENVNKFDRWGKDLSNNAMLTFKVPELVLLMEERHGIYLRLSNKRLHLITCYASIKGGIGDQMANYLKRTVVTYGEKTVIIGDDMMGFARNPSSGIFNPISGLPFFSVKAKPKIHIPKW